MDNSITQLPISVCGELTRYNDTISKGRVRVFYKGHNRNNTYITDTMAEELIASAPYTPIKGIYIDNDYSDHGQKRSEGRIYGIIPANPNFAWEDYEDEDGVIRTYACFDALYYTALYSEAAEIYGKGQSMELYSKTLVKEWAVIDGRKVVVLQHGCFLGLQVLGDSTEPCFEGAAFYTLQDVENLIVRLEQLQNYSTHEDNNGGKEEMPKINIAPEAQWLWDALNSNFVQEKDWEINYTICTYQDDSACVFNHTDNKFEIFSITVNEENEEKVFEKTGECFAFFASEEQHSNLNSLCENFSLEEIAKVLTDRNEQILNFEKIVGEKDTKITDLESNIATLETEKAQITSEYTALKAEKEELATFKKEVIDAEKQSILSNYTNLLSAEEIATYTNKLDSYSPEELDMRLTYAVKLANPSFFSKEDKPSSQVKLPKDEDVSNSISAILMRYEKN